MIDIENGTGPRLRGPAHPGSRLADLGYAAYRWAPLTDPTSPDGFATIDRQRQRFRRFCETYGEREHLAVLDAAIGRVGELVDLMRRLAGDGHPAFAGHVADGHDTLYLVDIEYEMRPRTRFVTFCGGVPTHRHARSTKHARG